MKITRSIHDIESELKRVASILRSKGFETEIEEKMEKTPGPVSRLLSKLSKNLKLFSRGDNQEKEQTK